MAVAELTSGRTTTVFSNILVATDFSEASRRALCDALALAAQTDAKLCVVHAVASDPQLSTVERPPELDLERQDAERQMTGFVGGLDCEQKIESTVVCRGTVAAVVESLIQEKNIDLLVIGTRGRSGLRKLALGSVAEELLREARCPVLTIGPRAELVPLRAPAEFRTILFATDFGKASAKALPLALALARAHRAKLILLHTMAAMPVTAGNLGGFVPSAASAQEFTEWQESVRKAGLKKLKEYLPPQTGLEQEPEYVVGMDFLPEGILTTAAERKADLIVMGANRVLSPRAVAHLPWVAVNEVVRNAACPVLTVAG